MQWRWRYGTAAIAVIVALGLTGCSADDLARGQLSQTAKTSASAARSAALSLGLDQKAMITMPVLETGLADAGQKLSSGATTVSSLSATGGIARQRDRILAAIRQAQDAVLGAQDALSASSDPKAVDAERQKLDDLSKQLQDAGQRLSTQ